MPQDSIDVDDDLHARLIAASKKGKGTATWEILKAWGKHHLLCSYTDCLILTIETDKAAPDANSGTRSSLKRAATLGLKSETPKQAHKTAACEATTSVIQPICSNNNYYNL